MNPAFIAFLAVLIALICIFLAFRFGKMFFKFFLAISFILFIGLAIYIALLFNDSINFREGITNERNLFLLDKDDELLAGIILKPVFRVTGADIFEEKIIESIDEDIIDASGVETRVEMERPDLPFKFPTENDFGIFKTQFRKDKDVLNDNYFKLFIFDISVFDKKLDESVSFSEYDLTIREIVNALQAEIPLRSLSELISGKEDLLIIDVEQRLFEELDELETDDVRGVLFSLMLEKILSSERDIKSALFLFNDGLLELYPETILLRIMDDLPTSLVNSIIENMEE